jgi:hypothetical protein
MDTVAALFDTAVTEALMPTGELPTVVPADVVYQVIDPTVPAETFAVVTAKLALPAVPAAIAPLCTPSVMVGVLVESSEPPKALLHATSVVRAPSAITSKPYLLTETKRILCFMRTSF